MQGILLVRRSSDYPKGTVSARHMLQIQRVKLEGSGTAEQMRMQNAQTIQEDD